MFSGSVVVAQDGKVTASAHTGYENRETGKLNSAESLYSIASVGKMFTAVAIAQLVEAGKLAYETPVPEVLPELEDQINAAITIDHLLHHTSGLTRMSGIDDDVLDAIQSNSDYFALVLSTGIRSAGPGEFAYRNANYFVLGEIIDRVSGQAYETYIRDHVGIPAGMSGPFFIRRDRVGAQRVSQPYLAVDFQTWWDSEEEIVTNDVDDFVHTPPVVTPAAGGGAYASAGDMLRFATALTDGTLISPASFEAMCAAAPDQAEDNSGYGRGCAFIVDEHGARVGHTGSAAGVHARFCLYLEQRVHVVVLSNHDGQAAPLFGEIDNLLRPE